MEVEIGPRSSELRVGDEVYRLPYGVEHHVEFDDVLAVLLASINARPSGEADVDLASEDRNVLGFSSDGLEWTAEAPADDRDDPEHVGYRYIFECFDGLYAVNLDGNCYEIDPASGAIVDSWPWNELPTPRGPVALSGEIQTVLTVSDRVVVRCREAEPTLHGFDETGRKLWESSGRRGAIHAADGRLYERVAHGPRSETWYLLDPDTGDRGETVESPL